MAGCASSAVSFSAAHLVKPPASSYAQRPLVSIGAGMGNSKWPLSREQIQVDFSASADLRRMTRRGGVVLLAHSYLCDRGDIDARIGDAQVYIYPFDAKGQWIDAFSTHRDEDYRGVYTIFVDVRRTSRLESIPPQEAFDLALEPQEICFFVTGHGALLNVYKSSVTRIPKSVIADVLKADSALR